MVILLLYRGPSRPEAATAVDIGTGSRTNPCGRRWRYDRSNPRWCKNRLPPPRRLAPDSRRSPRDVGSTPFRFEWSKTDAHWGEARCSLLASSRTQPFTQLNEPKTFQHHQCTPHRTMAHEGTPNFVFARIRVGDNIFYPLLYCVFSGHTVEIPLPITSARPAASSSCLAFLS